MDSTDVYWETGNYADDCIGELSNHKDECSEYKGDD